jgi:hypothetical protein
VPNPIRWSYAQVRAYAYIAYERVDVVGFQVDYELNGIPRAAIRLPLGRNSQTNDVATIHTIAAKLTEQQPVQIFCSFRNAAKSDKSVRTLGVPDKDFLLFDGFTSGGGYVRNNQGVAQYMVTCNSWLTQLNQGSIFSQSSHVANPAHYAYGALTIGAADSGSLDWTVLTEASRYVTSATLGKDVWGAAFFPWLTRLASQDGVWIVEKLLLGAGSNAAAQLALSRMAPGYGGAPYQPLQFDPKLSLNDDIATMIQNDVGMLTHDPEVLGNQTMWDTLVGRFASDYLFSIVPRVSDALVVPFTPGNRGAGGKAFETILSQEYTGVQADTASRRPLRAYGILSSLFSRTGYELPGQQPGPATMGVGGWYDTFKSGTVMIQSGPRWTGALLAPMLAPTPGVIGCAVAPGAGDPNDQNNKIPANARVAKSFLNAYAQARYAQEILQGRYGVVTGPFRVDIAPGSLVELEGASDVFSAADSDQLGLPYFGEVLRVSFAMDANAPMCGTAFHIGYLRSEAENNSDLTSVAKHPLYSQTFQGCALF